MATQADVSYGSHLTPTIRGVDVTRLVDQIDAALRAKGTPGRAVHEKADLKSELEHYGTSVPAIRSVAQDVASQHPELSHDDLVGPAGRCGWRRTTNDAWSRSNPRRSPTTPC